MPRTEKDIANIDMIGRMITAAGHTCAGYDPDQLARLNHLHVIVDAALVEAVAGQRRTGITWESIGDALGMTKQGALMGFGRRSRRLQVSDNRKSRIG